ncbi:MAG: hypothetical protein ABH830_01795 [Patescibacteria group bacterium]
MKNKNYLYQPKKEEKMGEKFVGDCSLCGAKNVEVEKVNDWSKVCFSRPCQDFITSRQNLGKEKVVILSPNFEPA